MFTVKICSNSSDIVARYIITIHYAVNTVFEILLAANIVRP